MVVAPHDPADAERRQERRHDPRAEDARTVVRIDMAEVVTTHVVIAAEDLSDEQHHE